MVLESSGQVRKLTLPHSFKIDWPRKFNRTITTFPEDGAQHLTFWSRLEIDRESAVTNRKLQRIVEITLTER